MRQTKGGGTRDVNFTLDTTADEIIEMGKMLFNPEGFCCFGYVGDMEFSLANYKQEIIHSVIVDNKVVPFTLQRYMYSTKLPKVRLYLASKAKISAHKEKERLQAQPPLTTEATEDLPEDPFDEILFSPMFDMQTTRALKAEQDKAYFESLINIIIFDAHDLLSGRAFSYFLQYKECHEKHISNGMSTYMHMSPSLCYSSPKQQGMTKQLNFEPWLSTSTVLWYIKIWTFIHHCHF